VVVVAGTMGDGASDMAGSVVAGTVGDGASDVAGKVVLLAGSPVAEGDFAARPPLEHAVTTTDAASTMTMDRNLTVSITL
jgi:hypothetical protein